MNKRTIRHYLGITITGVFCWLNASVVSAQTATDLNCSLCVGPGEVANGAVRWPSLDAAARGFLINQANDVNTAVALVATLETQVAALQATVVTLQASLATAEATVAANTTSIASNATDITGNTSSITTNATGVSTNTCLLYTSPSPRD